jgi:hypothetical protein
MAVLSLPLSFNNSFWTQDYRNGLEVLYNKLEQVRVLLMHSTHITDLPQGATENIEIVAFIRVSTRTTTVPVPC